MKSTANHRIHKQTLEVQFRDYTTAHSWAATNQAKTAEAVRRSIEQCFQDYDSTKEYLTIDRLELDLGTFSTEQLLSKMPEKLYRELHNILSSFRMNPNDFEEAETVEGVSSTNNWSVPGADKRIVSPIIKKSEVTAFLFFLQQGYLPWWCSNEPAWDQEWVQKLTTENWQELRDFLTAYHENDVHYERGLLRLVSQFSDGFLARVLNGLQLKEAVEKAWSWLLRFYETLQKTETDSFRNESSLPSLFVLRRHFWKRWISYAAGKSAIPKLAPLFDLIERPSLITYVLSGMAESYEWMDSSPDFWRGELTSLQQQENKNKPGLSVSNKLVNDGESEKLGESDIAEHITEKDFIIVPDAGLVLLHPFLPRLFEYCHWLNENEFVSDEARNRAVYALHYLTAGDEDAPEFVLMLPKLFCGIPLWQPLEPALPLTDAERTACDEMLIQAIAHWTVLRNTSPAALRQAFLRRQGKLITTDEKWRLEVQRKTEDILLNRLPWGFSMIKFSWMPRLLSVSWE